MTKLSQGALAVKSGQKVEDLVSRMFGTIQYDLCQAPTLKTFMEWGKGGLYAAPGRYTTQCDVPLVSPWHRQKRMAKIDFVAHTPANQYVLVSIKNQDGSGSADNKLDFEMMRLVSTELPAAMLINGPGWQQAILEEFWERCRHYGASRVLLFRTAPKLLSWMQAGLPVDGSGVRASDIFVQYCDREP